MTSTEPSGGSIEPKTRIDAMTRAGTTEGGAPGASAPRLGIREIPAVFSLLLLVNEFVGAMVGLRENGKPLPTGPGDQSRVAAVGSLLLSTPGLQRVDGPSKPLPRLLRDRLERGIADDGHHLLGIDCGDEDPAFALAHDDVARQKK